MFNADPTLLAQGAQMAMDDGERPMLDIRVDDHRYIPIQQVLDPCHLQVKEGEIVSLIGPSGCGKSTLLKIAAGLLEASDGAVVSHAQRSAVLFQEHRLLPWKNLYENMRFGLRRLGLSKQEEERRMQVAASSMGFVSDDLGKFPSKLSGGMKQRAALARALATQPDLLFLDEPFSALDIGRRREMYRLLLGEVMSRGCTVLMVTHDVTEALSLSDRVVVMAPDPGRLVTDYRVPVPMAERTRHVIADLESDFLSDDEIAGLFNMKDWEQVL